ncbi:MAG TPA: alanine racemase [Aquaticitalea sp.]|nr:alanine racemase [Aquaticitalea sp.]
MPKAQETVLEIDLKALNHNFRYLKSKINPDTKFMAVVKAFAYGSDACEIANCLQNIGADYFAVAYAQEGVALRNAGITKPILVLHPQPINFKTLIERCLEPSIYNAKILNEFIDVATAQNQTNYPVHIKFNTGLNRLGFSADEIDAILSRLKTTNAVKVVSYFSHLAASEDLDERPFTVNQINAYIAITEKMTSGLGYNPIRHLCNTSGILNYPEAHFDMVRSGIGLYGFGNSDKEDLNFKPIAALKSIISQIHHLQKGQSVGYNRAYKSDVALSTATIPIGHADGIGRQYGNGKGYVLINNQIAPIIGNVCMDMLMVNITDIACNEGDEVIVFDAAHPAHQLAKTANTISYEIITGISQRVKRVLLK